MIINLFKISLAQTVKNLLLCGRSGSILVSGRSPGEENGYPLQYSYLENSIYRGIWWAIYTLWGCSMPGFPVHHQLPELTQTHIHRVGDAIQPPHPLSSPSLLRLIFPSIRVFSHEPVLCIRWPKYWSFSFSISPSNEYSELISF